MKLYTYLNMAVDSAFVNETSEEFFRRFLDSENLIEKWTLFGSSVPVSGAVIVYLLLVLKVGPALMESRDAFRLKSTMRLYNLVQVLYNIYIVYFFLKPFGGTIPVVFLSDVSCKQSTDFTKLNNFARRFIFICWHFIIIKKIDLLDTVFMVLRKKWSQITFLHVYHHAATLYSCWFTITHIKASQGGLLMFLNACVHAVMYLYYFLATYKSLKPYLWWKQHLTHLQLGQFVVMICYMLLLTYYKCHISKLFVMLWMFNVTFVMCLFIHFYYTAYGSKKTQDNNNEDTKMKIS